MSFPRYPKYKDSGVEWLGEVPEHWEVRRLKFLCDIQTGDKDTVDAVEDGTYPFFVRSQTVERINSFTFDCEAVLTAGDGVGVGKVFHHYQGPFDFHQRVYMLNKFRAISGRFLFHFLRENFYKVALEGGAKSTVDSLRRPLFTNFPLSFPTADEQLAIVEFADRESERIDELVAEQRRLMELLKEKRQAVISHAVTKGLNPRVPMKPSGIEWLGDVPEHWEMQRIRQVTTFVTSGPRGWSERVGESGSLFIQSGDLNDSLDIEFATANRVEVGDDAETMRTRLCDGDIVVCITGAKTGNVAVAETVPEPAYVNQHLCLVRPSVRILPRFMAVLLKSVIGQTYFALSQYGLKQGLSLEDVKEAPVTLPPIAEQKAIVVHVNTETAELDALAAEAQKAIDLLQERRTALISAAVTGQIDVRKLAAA